jgi:hypothetical protein
LPAQANFRLRRRNGIRADPLCPGVGEDENAIVVCYIDAAGALQILRGAYNRETGTVDFVLSHFSRYAVANNKVAFSDVPAAPGLRTR